MISSIILTSAFTEAVSNPKARRSRSNGAKALPMQFGTSDHMQGIGYLPLKSAATEQRKRHKKASTSNDAKSKLHSLVTSSDTKRNGLNVLLKRAQCAIEATLTDLTEVRPILRFEVPQELDNGVVARSTRVVQRME